MIISVTFNPSIDHTVYVENFSYGSLNRVKEDRFDAAGKGINFASMLKNLGVDCICTGFNFSENGNELEKHLDKYGIPHSFIKCEGRIRTNVKLFNRADGKMTELNTSGSRVSADKADELVKKITDMTKPFDMVVLSGSFPPGVNAKICRQIISAVNSKGAYIAADLSGKTLAAVLDKEPYIIKPNEDEFHELFGFVPDNNGETVNAARSLINRQTKYVCVSMGRRGALLVSEEEEFFAVPAKLKAESLQGAGDGMLAGMCAAIIRGLGTREILLYGAAAAAATLICPGTQMGSSDDFERFKAEIEIKKAER